MATGALPIIQLQTTTPLQILRWHESEALCAFKALADFTMLLLMIGSLSYLLCVFSACAWLRLSILRRAKFNNQQLLQS
jgi:hypothetical protein